MTSLVSEPVGSTMLTSLPPLLASLAHVCFDLLSSPRGTTLPRDCGVWNLPLCLNYLCPVSLPVIWKQAERDQLYLTDPGLDHLPPLTVSEASCVCAKLLQSYLTPDPMDCSLPGSSVYGIL